MPDEPLRALTCSGCGAALTPKEGASVVTCTYCGRAHAFVAAPPKAAPAPLGFSAGAPVLVQWGAVWWNAVVLREVAAERWEVRYDGWSSAWDEVVGPDRIAARPPTAAAAPAPLPTSGRIKLAVWGLALAIAAVLIAVALHSPSRPPPLREPTRAALAPTTPLTAGDDVEVEWQGTWYEAKVLSFEPAGRVRIHYVGWSSSWDEAVSRDRVRR